MELDDFKKIINENATVEPIFTEANVEEMKSRKSLHPVEKIKKKILYENIIGVVLVLALVIFMAVLAFVKDADVNVFHYGSIVFIILFLIYALSFVFKLHRMVYYEGNMKDFLIRFNKVIKSYIKIGAQSTAVAFPFGIYLGATMEGHEFSDFLAKATGSLTESLTLIGLSVICIYGGYRLAVWFYSILYGAHVKEIEELIEEFEQEQ